MAEIACGGDSRSISCTARISLRNLWVLSAHVGAFDLNGARVARVDHHHCQKDSSLVSE